MPPKEPPRVAVLVDTSTGWGRRMIRGIVNYVRKHDPWHLWIEARGQDEPLQLPAGWEGEGIIARVATRRCANALRRQQVPVVNVSGIQLSGVDFPRVTTDYTGTAELAVDHFVNLGLKSFAYCGPAELGYVEHHRRAFEDVLRRRGFTCDVYRPGTPRSRSSGWLAQQKDFSRWLGELAKPVGVFTWGHRRGREVLDACRWAGVLVPEQAAVLAGDDDELLGNACTPPLSGIVVASEQIGLQAAASLDRLMRGRPPRKKPVLIKPSGISARRSTDALAIDDPDLAAAVNFIRNHSKSPITVADVARKVAISRRRLERAFQEVLGRTPAAELRRMRLATAKDLLLNTDLSVADVAPRSGFGSAEYMSCVFKAELGVTPLKYRSKMRGR